MTIDWNEAAVGLKRDVDKHGGFLTLQKDELARRFDIGRLAEKITEELVDTLRSYGDDRLSAPLPACRGRRSASTMSKARSGRSHGPFVEPQDSAGDGDRRRREPARARDRREASADPSVCRGYRRLTCSFSSSSGDRPRAGRISMTVVSLTSSSRPSPQSLELTADLAHATATIRMAGAVYACRPRESRWEGAPARVPVEARCGTRAILAEAARKQKEIFDGVLREAAKHLHGGAEVPSCDVDLGRLGLRYRREAQGDI